MFKVGPRETNEFSLFPSLYLGVHGDCRRVSEEVVGGGGDPLIVGGFISWFREKFGVCIVCIVQLRNDENIE